MIRNKAYWLSLIGMVFVINGCALFTPNKDRTRHVNFNKLEAIHIKLFDWSVGSGNAWNKKKVASYCDRGDLSFKEALEIAKSKDNSDNDRQKSVKILWDEFKENCKFVLHKNKLFSKAFKDNMLPEIKRNYHYAIAGELSSVSASQ